MTTTTTTDNRRESFAISMLKTSPELQVRTSDLDLTGKKMRLQHIENLAAKLTGKKQLRPIEIGFCGGEFWVLDGHHRLEAYKQAKRCSIPAYVRTFKTWTDLKAWTLLNANEDTNQSLNMSQTERVNQAWQFYCLTTEFGKKKSPLKVSEWKDRFGIGKNTPAAFKFALIGATLHDVIEDWIETGEVPPWHKTRLYQLDGRAGKVTPMSSEKQITAWKVDETLVSSIQTQMLAMFRQYGFVPEIVMGFSKALSVVEAHSDYKLGDVCEQEFSHISDIEYKLVSSLRSGHALDVSEFDDLEF